jgi:DNA-binding CsgD family transcriptional regulator/tetratricopeptide (TPR) repeat protein
MHSLPRDSPALFERGAPLLDLSRLLGEAAEGHGRLVFIGGEAGFGKTALVRRFGEMISDGASMLVGGCDPLSPPQPLGPLLDIVDRLPGAPIRLESGKDRIFRDVLASISTSERPLVLVFEDVHWADEATLDLLRFLGRRVDERRALLLATYRDDEVGDRHPLRLVFGDLATAPGVYRMTLGPLTLESVRQLASGRDVDADELFRHTGGNPFFLTEILAAGGERIPPTVRDAVLSRVGRLPEKGRLVLAAASVIGTRSEPWLLERLTDGDSDAIDTCLASGMLSVQQNAYAFRHELAREAVLGTVAPQRRIDLHRSVLEALRTSSGVNAEPARLAYHAEEARDTAAVLEYAPRAASRAEALHAHREAAAQYERALRFADHLSAPERAELWVGYSAECAANDRWNEAIRADFELIALWRAEGNRLMEGWSLGFLAGCLINSGRIQEAEDALHAAIRILESLPPGIELAETYSRAAMLRIHTSDPEAAMEWARRAIRLTELIGDRRGPLGYPALGMALMLAGNLEGERYLKQVLDRARAAPDPWSSAVTASAYFWLAWAWGDRYQFARAEPYLEEGVPFAAEHELEGVLMQMLAWQALVHLELGRWPEADAAATRVIDRATHGAISRTTALLAKARLEVRRGGSGSEDVLDEMLTLAERTGTIPRVGPARAARAEAAWLSDDLDRVRAEAASALELALEKRHPWIAGELLWWLSSSGEVVEVPDWIATPFALQIAGNWVAAHAEWQRRGCVYEAAQALAEVGDAESLRSALAAFERLGAVPAAHRTLRRLRERGIRGIPRGPRPTTRTNFGGLTRRQMEILRLLGEGLRNADIAKLLFLSPKTVDHHVSAILSKLGVRTRGEAVREAIRLERLQSEDGSGAN